MAPAAGWNNAADGEGGERLPLAPLLVGGAANVTTRLDTNDSVAAAGSESDWRRRQCSGGNNDNDSSDSRLIAAAAIASPVASAAATTTTPARNKATPASDTTTRRRRRRQQQQHDHANNHDYANTTRATRSFALNVAAAAAEAEQPTKTTAIATSCSRILLSVGDPPLDREGGATNEGAEEDQDATADGGPLALVQRGGRHPIWHLATKRLLPGDDHDEVNDGGDDECCYATGETTRCNCSGRRRATLAGLIELFEQKVRVDVEPTSSRRRHRSRRQQQQQQREQQLQRRQPNLQRQHRYRKLGISNSSSPAAAAEATAAVAAQHSTSTTTNRNKCKVNKAAREEKPSPQQQHNRIRMRNIITPVKYELSEAEEEEADSLDDDDDGDKHNAGDLSPATRVRNRSLHHAAVKGVPVLPNHQRDPDPRKLTATRWQPPTNGRQYEAAASQSAPASRTPTTSTASRTSLARAQFRPTSASSAPGEQVPAAQCHSSRRQPANPSKQTSSNHHQQHTSASLAATRGPSIVKHQASSSRRLLHQLARLRRLSEPSYRVKRPEKVEQVESLIEQLERATAEWEEDEFLLERAERRDWPAEYHERFPRDQSTVADVAATPNNYPIGRPPPPSRIELPVSEPDDQQLNFGRRDDVNPLEEEAIARAHHRHHQMEPGGAIASGRVKFGGSWSAGSMRPRGGQQRRRAFADRYNDDLAVRRLSRSPAGSCVGADDPFEWSFGSGGQRPRQKQQQPQMSYLLCSNAYTPTTIDSPCSPGFAAGRGHWWDNSLERAHSDDLHFRNVRPAKLEPHEPPFGIPRQLASAGAHSSASHYLRRQHLVEAKDGVRGGAQAAAAANKPSCLCACVHHHCEQSQAAATATSTTHCGGAGLSPIGGHKPRTDSKVSFVSSTAGRTSADSGLAGELPLSPTGRQSASSRLTPGPRSPRLVGPSTAATESAHGSLTRRPRIRGEFVANAPRTTACGSRSPYRDDEQLHDGGCYVDEDVAEEIDLAEELARGASMSRRTADEWMASEAVACESPLVECHTAEFRATPVRRRPKIKIENPRSKSPLLRVSSPSSPTTTAGPRQPGASEAHATRQSRKQPPVADGATGRHYRQTQHEEANNRRQDSQAESAPQTTVQIQCYTDTVKTTKRSSLTRVTSELECHYDFDDDDDEAHDSSEEQARPRRIVTTTTLVTSDSSMNESSVERLNYRGESPRATTTAKVVAAAATSSPEGKPSDQSSSSPASQQQRQRDRKDGPLFSIGEYKSLDKRELKIL